MLVGTPHYMAPELLTGGTVCPQTDQYSLGIVAYRLLSGRLPFRDENVFIGHALTPPPNPRAFNPRLPGTACDIVLRMLAKKPEERYGACRTAVADLCDALFGGS
jgi:serine/threonine-protein kinase